MKAVVAVAAGQRLAGLAAALALAEDGHDVTVVDAADADGDAGDDGPRFVLAWHAATRRLIDRLDAAGELEAREVLAFLADDGASASRVALRALPPPLDVLTSVAAFNALSWVDRGLALRVAAAVRFPSRLQAAATEEDSADAWLSKLGQSERARRILWSPLARLVAEQDLGASSRTLAAALRETLAEAQRPRVALFRHGAPDRLAATLIARLVRAGAKVRRARPKQLTVEPRGEVQLVRGLQVEDDGGSGTIDAEVVLAALSPATVAALIPPPLRAAEPFFDKLAALPPSCRVVVELRLAATPQTPRAGKPHPFALAGTPGASFDWLQIEAADTAEPRARFTSAVAAPHAGHDDAAADAALVDEALAWVRRSDVLPGARLVTSSVRRVENGLRLAPGVERHRPRARAPVEGLFLCASWVRTGQPTTLEGALRAAEEAASLATTWQPPPPPRLPQGFVPASTLVRRKPAAP